MNIFGYLEYRGDVPLRDAPFNDVDNLILAELSYTDFGGIVPEDGREISIERRRPVPGYAAGFLSE